MEGGEGVFTFTQEKEKEQDDALLHPAQYAWHDATRFTTTPKKEKESYSFNNHFGHFGSNLCHAGFPRLPNTTSADLVRSHP